jgi:hypothetical protein
VLLKAFEKPDNYTSQKSKKEVKNHLNITDKYYKKFLLTPQSYEKSKK